MSLLRSFVPNSRKVLASTRSLNVSSVDTSLVDLNVDEDGIATVTMKRKPVNALSLELIQEITKAIDEVESNNCKGMVLNSIFPRVFTAGLDFKELYKPDPERFRAYHQAFHTLWTKLYGSNLVTAAAVTGHSPAGGCLLACTCDYRVMVSGFKIGLNETAVGVFIAPWAFELFSSVISRRRAEYALFTSHMFSTEEALKAELIDEIATDKDDAVEKCKKFIKKFDNLSSPARVRVKQISREGLLKRAHENYDKQDFQIALKHLVDIKTHTMIESYTEKLRKEKK